MKLYELTESTVVTEYERRTSNSEQIFDKLKQLGYTMLGGGMDATVWAKETGSVIKILMPSQDKDVADKSFLAFYEICKDNPQNPHLPQFVDIGGEHHTVFELNGVPYRQISMERLQPIKTKSIEEAMVWALSDLATVAFIKWRDVLKQIVTDEFWKDFPYKFDKSRVTQLLSNQQAEEYYHNLFATMQDLYVRGRQQGLGWDLHTENVMQRADGTLVIVDPYFR